MQIEFSGPQSKCHMGRWKLWNTFLVENSRWQLVPNLKSKYTSSANCSECLEKTVRTNERKQWDDAWKLHNPNLLAASSSLRSTLATQWFTHFPATSTRHRCVTVRHRYVTETLLSSCSQEQNSQALRNFFRPRIKFLCGFLSSQSIWVLFCFFWFFFFFRGGGGGGVFLNLKKRAGKMPFYPL